MRPIRLRALGGCAVLALLAACEAAPRVGDPRPQDPVTAGTFASLADGIFTPRCATAACHGGDPSPAPTSFDRALAWGQLVDVSASQDPTLKLVAPGDPARSYLVLKLRRQGSPATDMPPGDPLTEAEILSIEAWIANGAPND